MATAIKHKKRSRKVWQANAGTRNHIFSIMSQNAAGILQARLMRDMTKEGM